MSNNVSKQILDFISRVTADPGTTTWGWQWPYKLEDPEGGQLFAYIQVRGINPSGIVLIDSWYMGNDYRNRRPPGVVGDNVPAQIFYDAIVAGKLQKFNVDSLQLPEEDDYELVRKAIVSLLNMNRQHATFKEVQSACNVNLTMERLTLAMCVMKAKEIVGWGDKVPSADTHVQFLRPLSLRSPYRR